MTMITTTAILTRMEMARRANRACKSQCIKRSWHAWISGLGVGGKRHLLKSWIYLGTKKAFGGLIYSLMHSSRCGTVYQDLILYRNMFTIQVLIGAPKGEGVHATVMVGSHKWDVQAKRLRPSLSLPYRELPSLRCLLQKTPLQAGNVLPEQTLINLLNFLYLSLNSTGVLMSPSDHSVSSCLPRPDHCIWASISQPNN